MNLICQYVHLEPPCLSDICDCVSTDFWINFGQQVTTWHRHLGGLIQWRLRPVTGHWRLPRRHLRHPPLRRPVDCHLGHPLIWSLRRWLRQWPPCKRKRPQPGQSVTSPMASEMASQPSRQWPHSESSPVNSEMASEASNQGPPWVFSPVASEAPWVSMPRWASRPVASESEASSELPPGSSMMSSWNSPQEPEPEPEH